MYVTFTFTKTSKPQHWTQRRRQTKILNKCANALWKFSKIFFVKGKFPMESWFDESLEKRTPSENKQNIKCSPYNLLYLQNHSKVFLFYSSRLILFMFLSRFSTSRLFSHEATFFAAKIFDKGKHRARPHKFK